MRSGTRRGRRPSTTVFYAVRKKADLRSRAEKPGNASRRTPPNRSRRRARATDADSGNSDAATHSGG